MIIFEGDYLLLASNNQWEQVISITDNMTVVTESGTVHASDRHVLQVLSISEYEAQYRSRA
jgi:hypothetical protein